MVAAREHFEASWAKNIRDRHEKPIRYEQRAAYT
jgi:hypothetical protein